ncbi:hypothetical protein [Methanoregula formicica]|uniref:Uncharacterized protein n=1 Tax=Methanoregula formicica (strain DSM 22288 / NBRC 105244 / SMSP) TaxID=593750 RepID=L0HAW2_METFS|nr:hypothetical protein [Methanoregula formicica]AGB01887.1 hypothetical protein Metfor_0829 [Methanoregula formicica SMSP]
MIIIIHGSYVCQLMQAGPAPAVPGHKEQEIDITGCNDNTGRILFC